MTVTQRLQALRAEMKQRGIYAYFVPSSDYHQSETPGEYFRCRAYLSGFSGSAGTLIVTDTEAFLWTDGRYFIQAERQLSGSGITLCKMGEENVPTVEEYIATALPEGCVFGFDGKVVSAKDGERFAATLEDKKISLHTTEDLCGLIWEDRPPLSREKAFRLAEKYAGKSTAKKLSQIREEMKRQGADTHVVASLDDIAWIYNIRGNDIACTPLVLSYSIITQSSAALFLNDGVADEALKEGLQKEGVTVLPYDALLSTISALSPDARILLDKNKVSYALLRSIPDGATVISGENPSSLMKAIKNSVEIENLRISHLWDGVAVTKFMYWLKKNVGKIEMTEGSASEKLLEFRRQQPDFIEPSFNTIAAYNENAAMMHYKPDDQGGASLKAEGFLLVDSGGQYFTGTTDITRTFVLGPVPALWKLHYTTVLRSMLGLSSARFLYGCRGINLDILARGPLWDLNIDYKCGTGHGVAYLSCVHEAPNGFRWKVVPERNDSCILEEGMVTTDEPGVYMEGSHGIRIENELLCQKGDKIGSDQFMYFETLTYAPIDLDAVDPSLLSFREKEALNSYHAMVYEKIAPHLTNEERDWLKEYTKAV